MKIVDPNDNGQGGNAGGPAPGAGGISREALKDAKDLVCENCGGVTFMEALQFKVISKFLTGSEKDTVVPAQTIVCVNCGHAHEMFKPQV